MANRAYVKAGEPPCHLTLDERKNLKAAKEMPREVENEDEKFTPIHINPWIKAISRLRLVNNAFRSTLRPGMTHDWPLKMRNICFGVFPFNDFTCKHCGVICVNPILVMQLNKLALSLSDTVYISTSYRCPEYNKECGKILTPNENDIQHERGNAADIYVSDCFSDDFCKCHRMFANGKAFVFDKVSEKATELNYKKEREKRLLKYEEFYKSVVDSKFFTAVGHSPETGLVHVDIRDYGNVYPNTYMFEGT